MKDVDANVLLYAVNADSRHHQPSGSWLDRALSGGDVVGLTWIALLEFLRISTKDGLFPQPLETADALDQVNDWLAAPSAQLVSPGGGHSSILERLLRQVGTGGNLVNDAHLAAIAVEQRADIVSYDNDFGRFPEIRWHRPADLLS